jgi:8-oxo-dGTP pyrophosphatase MutT (NUDIX family)
MASLGHGNYFVVVLLVGGSKASGIKLVLQREPRTGKTWFPAGSILPNEAPVDAAVRELFEEKWPNSHRRRSYYVVER